MSPSLKDTFLLPSFATSPHSEFRAEPFSRYLTGLLQGVKSPMKLTNLGVVYALLKQTVNVFKKYVEMLIKLLFGPLVGF